MSSHDSLAKAIAARVAEENAVRQKLAQFAEAFYSAIEALIPEFEAAGLKVSARRAQVEESRRLELSEETLHDRVLFMTQHQVAYVPEHPGAHGALFVFVISEGSGQGVPVERFLVNRTGEVHCEGMIAPLEETDVETLARRLIAAIWAQRQTIWQPLEVTGPLPVSELEMPRLRGQIGFRPRVALPSLGVRLTRER